MKLTLKRAVAVTILVLCFVAFVAVIQMTDRAFEPVGPDPFAQVFASKPIPDTGLPAVDGGEDRDNPFAQFGPKPRPLPGPQAAERPFKDAAAAYDKGDYTTALRLFRPLAEQGYGPAQFRLGAMYASGQGTAVNYAEAMKLFRLAADKGNPDAQYGLGGMYFGRQGVPQDDAEAAKWFRLSADQGYPYAQSVLGFMYMNGRGVPQNSVEAARLFRLAADQGNGTAQYYLGDMYESGEGLPKDYVLAHMWFNLSAAKGDQSAVFSRDELEKRMTPAQMAEAQKLAREWKPTTSPR